MRRSTRGLLVAVLVAAGLAPMAVTSLPADAATTNCAGLPAALETAVDGDVITITESACTLDDLYIRPGVQITLQGQPTVISDSDRFNGRRILSGEDNGDSVFR